MSIDMERSRDGYRGRYRDQHDNGSINRSNHDDRSIRGNYRGRPSHSGDHNGNYLPRSSPNSGYNYRSSRTSLNSRPISSRNGPSTHYRHPRNDDYQHISSSSSNRTSSGQSNYYDNHSPSSRFDRQSNHREIYPSLLDEQPSLSSGSSLHYPSSPSISLLRDRVLPLPSSQYVDAERNRYIPPSAIHRRDNSPPIVSRSIDYGSRNTSNDIYVRGEYRSSIPSPSASLSTRGAPYGDTYRANDYNTRSERYDIPSNRTNTSSSRDYPMPSSSYRNDLYRSSSNVSMPSPSSYVTREQYPPDVNYRPISQSRDYENTSSLRSASMDHQDAVSRNSRDRNHSSHQDRPNLKRSGPRYNDNGPTPSKRPMRR